MPENQTAPYNSYTSADPPEAGSSGTPDHCLQDPMTKRRFEHRIYKRIANQLRERVEKGPLNPGDPFPVIGELCTQFGCTRQTAAKVLHVLEGEGIAERVPGLGWFVA
jgi:DNA-binding FadR family transcriptional regulator